MAMGEGKYKDARIEGIAFQEDEPWFLLRGQDQLTPAAMEMYAHLLDVARANADLTPDDANDLWRGAQDVRAFAQRVRDWQRGHETKLPD